MCSPPLFPRLIGPILALMILAATASAATHVVRPDGTGDYPTIQAAIVAAVGGDIIELTDGTFVGNGNRDLDLLGKAITIRSQSGIPAGCIIDCQGTVTDRHRGFLIQNGETLSTVIENLTVKQGYVWDETMWQGEGGGILIRGGSSPTIQGCRIRECTSLQGGGIYVDGGAPRIADCGIEQNVCGEFFLGGGGEGGGIYIRGGATPTIQGCQVVNNSAQGGGGIRSHDASPEIFACSISQNDAGTAIGGGRGGGLYCTGGAPLVSDCEINTNGSGWNFNGYGGGISASGAAMIVDCTIANNTTDGEAGGAELTNGATMERCVITGSNSYLGGGGVRMSGNATLRDCLVAQNAVAERGGGIYASGVVTIAGCTVADNEGSDGGGIYAATGANLQLIGTIVWDNCGPSTVPSRNIYVGGYFNVECSDIELDGIDGPGQLNLGPDVIHLAPLFCQPGGCTTHNPAGDYRLQENSPAAAANAPPACGLIGALDVGCGATSVEPTTWGAVKAGFRN